MRAGCDLAEAGSVGFDFPDLPASAAAGHREEDLACVEVEVEVADELAGGGAEEGGEATVGTRRREDGYFVVVSGWGECAVALPVLREAEFFVAAFYEEELFEIEERVFEKDLLLEGEELVDKGFGAGTCGLVGGGEAAFKVEQTVFEFIDAVEIFAAVRVAVGESLREVTYGEPEGRNVGGL